MRTTKLQRLAPYMILKSTWLPAREGTKTRKVIYEGIDEHGYVKMLCLYADGKTSVRTILPTSFVNNYVPEELALSVTKHDPKHDDAELTQLRARVVLAVDFNEGPASIDVDASLLFYLFRKYEFQCSAARQWASSTQRVESALQEVRNNYEQARHDAQVWEENTIAASQGVEILFNGVLRLLDEAKKIVSAVDPELLAAIPTWVKPSAPTPEEPPNPTPEEPTAS